MYSRHPRQLIEDLAQKAMREALLCSKIPSSDVPRWIARQIKEGKTIPEYLKPGYIIKNLPPEVRETLSNLKSDDVKTMMAYLP